MPKSKIVWALERPTDQLLASHPDIDELFLVPKDWLHDPATIFQLRRELKLRNFDIAIDPQSILKSSALAWLSGARYRIGFRGNHSRELSQCFNNIRVLSEKSHLVDRSLDLLRPLGIRPRPAEFKLPVTQTADAFVASWQKENEIDRYFVLNPGASWQSKLWDNQRFGEVAYRVWQNTGLRPVISWAGASEKAMADEIALTARGAAIVAPQTSLVQLSALLKSAEYYLGCDTGPMHLACAVGTPCVGLFGTTRPQDSGPYGRQHLSVQRWYQSGTCRERRQAANEAMMAIQVEEVTIACLQMYEQTRSFAPCPIAA